jgi:anti-sigma B factor antagonist
MEIRERVEGNVTVVGLVGRFTVSDQPNVLRNAVVGAVERGARHVLLDLAGVQYLDSTRLGELIAAHVTVSRSGGRLTLVATPRRIAELLAIAGLDRIFEQFPTVADATKNLN